MTTATRLNIALLLIMAWLLALAPARAGKLAPGKWHVTDASSGQPVAVVTDNRAETKWSGKGLLIDLGRDTLLQRIYLTSGDGAAGYAQVRLTFLQQPDGDAQAVTRNYTRPTCEWWQVREQRLKLLATSKEDFLPLNTPAADLRFNPTPARYLRIETAEPIAELELYGSAEKAAFIKRDAVVLPPNAPDVLRVAAEDLRYYLGELTGHPLPIIDPAQAADYPGTRYTIVDLAPLAKTYDEMVANQQAGKLPDGVNVERDGQAVVFKAWPYRNVAYSVWEFLRRQGVVWAALDDHADFVPAGKGVKLDMLPLRFQPTASVRQGGIGAGPGHLSAFGHGQSFYLDDILFLLRNGNTSDMSTYLDNDREVPPAPELQTRNPGAKDLKAEYREGFEGHPHNLQSVVPDRLLQEHAEWCGMNAAGQRLPPSKGGPMFCMTNPELIQFVADKMVYWSGDNPQSRATFRLVPLDGTTFCQCERCRALSQPFEKASVAYCTGPHSESDPYYYFIAEVAKRVKTQRPQLTIEAQAYADYTLPPRHIAQMPDNVTMQVCIYGARNLPLSHGPVNAPVRAYLEEWTRHCARFSQWDYLLIHSEWRTLTMPIPMVSAIVDREQYLAKLGMQNGLTQADNGSTVHNPWNHYAHMRMLWDNHLTADRILDEFFPAYYQEAGTPMLAYYRALEQQLLQHNVSLQDFAYDNGPNPEMFTPALINTLRIQLDKAQRLAVSWYVKQRVQTARQDFEWAVTAASRRSLDMATALKYGKQQYVVARRHGPITLDGKLDDAGWQGLPEATGFRLPGKGELLAPEAQTAFRMTWDDAALYIAVRCTNANAATLQPTDNVWGTDNFEFFFAPEHTFASAYYQMAVSAFGKSWGPTHFLGHMWNVDDTVIPPFTTAVARENGYWVCEMTVPFTSLKEGAPKAGDSWRVNLARNRGCWSALPIGNWHLYRDYDFITFAGEAGNNGKKE